MMMGVHEDILVHVLSQRLEVYLRRFKIYWSYFYFLFFYKSSVS